MFACNHFLVKHELFKFRTLKKLKPFQHITQLSHSHNYFFKKKQTKLQSKRLYFQLCTRSRMCLLLNWQTCKL